MEVSQILHTKIQSRNIWFAAKWKLDQNGK